VSYAKPAPREVIAVFRVEDIMEVLGRRPTREEVKLICRALGHSSIGEVFVDIVYACRDQSLDREEE